MAKKEFPEIKEKNEGKFTKWVEKNMGGMDTCKAASKIMRSKTKKYSPAVVKMANYANNFGCKTKKEGASMDHGKKGASFNPKLKKAVADGKIKNKKFANAVMGASSEKMKPKKAITGSIPKTGSKGDEYVKEDLQVSKEMRASFKKRHPKANLKSDHQFRQDAINRNEKYRPERQRGKLERKYMKKV